MADNKDNKVTDNKNAGPKTSDSKREGEVENAQAVGGANQDLQDRRSSVFGDNTSSTGGANNPGQHGRDGGEINGQTNNPAPDENTVKGEAADDMQKEG
jgi:hypothetical protein